MPNIGHMVRTMPYPVIEDGNFSFPGGSYEVTPQAGENGKTSVVLQHDLSGAPLIENLIQRGDARYACLVSVKKTGYRKLELADSSRQAIRWDSGVAGEQPILGPLILYVGDDLRQKLSAQDGVAKAWQNQTIQIPRGARLAKAGHLHPEMSIHHLIRVRIKKDLNPGGFLFRSIPTKAVTSPWKPRRIFFALCRTRKGLLRSEKVYSPMQ